MPQAQRYVLLDESQEKAKPKAAPKVGWREEMEAGLRQGARAASPLGAPFGDAVADVVLHPIDNAPMLGAIGATIATGGASFPAIVAASALGGAGGAGVRSIYNQTVEGKREMPDDVFMDMAKEALVNGALSGSTEAIVRGLGPVANAVGRSVLKTPVPILEDFPNFSKLGATRVAKRIVQKVYDRGLIPGTDEAARLMQEGPGGITDLMRQKDALLRDASQRGDTWIDPAKQIQPVFDRMRASQGGTYNEAANAAIAEKEAEFLRNQQITRPTMKPRVTSTWEEPSVNPWEPGPRVLRDNITPTEADRLGTGDYQQVRDTEWGQRSSPGVQTTKATGQAWKEAAKDAVPETRDLYREVSEMIPAKDALERAAHRGHNREPISLKAAEVFSKDPTTAIATGFFDRPPMWGRLGYGLDRAGRTAMQAPPSVRQLLVQLLKQKLGAMIMPSSQE